MNQSYKHPNTEYEFHVTLSTSVSFGCSAVGAAALNDRLYVCGGYDGVSSLNTVECYHPDSDTWTTIPPMQKHRSAGGVIGFEGFVYALGGHDGLSIFDTVIVAFTSDNVIR